MPDGSRARRMLVCHVCAKGRRVTPEQLLQYTSTGWPKCCGEVMTLYVEEDKPEDDGEESDYSGG